MLLRSVDRVTQRLESTLPRRCQALSDADPPRARAIDPIISPAGALTAEGEWIRR
jgi:hypothetical protein